MATKKEDVAVTKTSLAAADPFTTFRQFASEFDRFFHDPWSFRWPSLRPSAAAAGWVPQIDVFEKDQHLVTKIDLPGMKKDDVKVEVADGDLVISGERKSETEEKKEDVYRCEREYGSFYRAVPLPEGVNLADVKATFADGVLEVSVPLPAKAPSKIRTVEIEEAKAGKAA